MTLSPVPGAGCTLGSRLPLPHHGPLLAGLTEVRLQQLALIVLAGGQQGVLAGGQQGKLSCTKFSCIYGYHHQESNTQDFKQWNQHYVIKLVLNKV